MNNKVSLVFAFLLGGVCGGVAAWKYSERIHKKVFEAQVEANVELELRRRKENNSTQNGKQTSRDIPAKPDLKEYAKTIKKYEYSSEDVMDEEEMKEPYIIKDDDDSIVLIGPEELGLDESYNIRELTYYADGVLVNEDDEVIDIPTALIGPDALNHFGDYVDNCVFVCNNEAQCYYEVTKVKFDFNQDQI